MNADCGPNIGLRATELRNTSDPVAAIEAIPMIDMKPNRTKEAAPPIADPNTPPK